MLFGKPIQQEVACRAYRELAREGLVTPRAILDAGWDRLVEVLDRGHYVRFDFSTATKLLEVSGALLERYGRLTALLDAAAGRADLARRLQEFRGVGPTTARIFLRGIGGARRALSGAGRPAERREGRSACRRAGPRHERARGGR
jgi:endonuclease III